MGKHVLGVFGNNTAHRSPTKWARTLDHLAVHTIGATSRPARQPPHMHRVMCIQSLPGQLHQKLLPLPCVLLWPQVALLLFMRVWGSESYLKKGYWSSRVMAVLPQHRQNIC